MKNISWCLLFTFLFVCCKRPTIRTGLEGKEMPVINILGLDSSSMYSTVDIQMGTPSVLFYFSPHCPFCRAQLDEMVKNMDVLKGLQIYMITNFSLAETRQFYTEYKLGSFQNIKVGIDTHFVFVKYFGAWGVPYSAIYGKDKRLRGAYMGPARTKDILAVANQ